MLIPKLRHFLFLLSVLIPVSALAADEALFKKLGVKAINPVLAPEISLSDNNGLTISSKNLQGQLILVNFWATWCSPCLTEMPALDRLYRRYKNQGFSLLAVNTDSHQRKRINTIARKLALTFPILLDENEVLSKQFGVSGMPASYVIDREGRLIAYIEGARDWDSETAHEWLENMLAQGQGDINRK
ncbi:MAG: TlpA family protein disulfide reductase [Pseudomonadales bacterium]|nr:TlpA family protein disulfide reductase [Pseudomonadales bacterium]